MRERDSKPTFFWRGLFIILPLVLLAGLGVYFLRQDRLLAETQAAQHCRAWSALLAESIDPLCPADFSSFTVDRHGNLLAIDGSTNKAHVAGLIPHPLPVDALTVPQAAQWRKISGSESSPDAATNELRQFISSSPPLPFLSLARYDLALRTADAQLFSAVAQDRQTLTAAGIPLWLLAEYQQCHRRPSPETTEMLCSNAVNYPALISPEILERSSASPKWQRQWDADAAAREFFAAAKEKFSAGGSAFWVSWKGESWLARKSSDSHDWRAVSATALRAAITNSPGWPRPAYAGAKIEIAGRNLFDSAGPELARAEHGATRVIATLADANALYAEQRQRTFWFACVILVSSIAAAAGLASAYRGFREQLRLNELKSNFVSSASHELRAPIASMRLLAESLERGKVADAPKREEYYRLLAQESRRLSMLIENILDFSRIDQGRKRYEMEPTDLNALVTQTVRLMEPAASERGVILAATELPPGDAVADGDGLALRQALINLMDNAIKHSPPGASVRVALEAANGTTALWVEDAGPGIPADEHEKIFERFYRLGTELRRETQGIGIGLSIVKHIAEGHGGRVVVRSAPGEGSRFTIEWPAHGEKP